jgi:hypothetical protein
MTILHILQHSLGLDQHGRGSMYRNHFVTGEGSTDWAYCTEAVGLGLMERRESKLCGGDSVFTVTDAGRQFVRDQSPPPPKRTRSQARYYAFLNADWFPGSFGDWIKSQHGNTQRTPS